MIGVVVEIFVGVEVVAVVVVGVVVGEQHFSLNLLDYSNLIE